MEVDQFSRYVQQAIFKIWKAGRQTAIRYEVQSMFYALNNKMNDLEFKQRLVRQKFIKDNSDRVKNRIK